MQFAIAADGVRLAFEQLGAGDPVLLVHGFGSSREQNWKSTGWYRSLTEAGQALVVAVSQGAEERYDQIIAAFGRDRLEHLHHLLEALSESLPR